MPKTKNKKKTSVEPVLEPFGEDLIEQALVGVFKIDLKEDKFIYANRVLARFFGYPTIADLKRARKTIPFKSNAEAKVFEQALSKNNKLVDFELEVITRNGEYKVFLVNALKKKGVLGGMMVDITDRQSARRALIDSEARYRDIVQNSPDMIHAVDREGTIVFSNQREQEVLGYCHNEMIGRHIRTIYTPELWKQVRDGFKKLRKEGKLFVASGKMRKKNGDAIDVEIHSLAIYDQKHHFLHTRSIIHDVTERTRSEEALKRSERKWRTLVESSPDFILIVNRSEKIEFINRLQPGFKLEKVLDSSVYDYVPKSSRPVLKKLLRKAFDTGRAQKAEIKGVGPYGRMTYYSTRVAPVEQEGAIESVILFAGDVTEQRQIHDELKEKVEQMEFMGRLNLKRHKRMREMEIELTKLKEKLKKSHLL